MKLHRRSHLPIVAASGLLDQPVAVPWWNGATLNTLWHTRRHGELVGADEAGNLYYRTRGGAIDPVATGSRAPQSQSPARRERD